MRKRTSTLAHALFLAAMALKAADGALELLAGALLLAESRATIVSWLRELTAPELKEDPGDFVATHVRLWAPRLLDRFHGLATAYLIAQGAIKLAVVVAVLRGAIKIMPWATLVIGLFGVYLGYRAASARSPAVAFLAVLDLIVAALIWLEFEKRRSHPA